MTFSVMQRRLVWVQLGLYVGLALGGLLFELPLLLGHGGGLWLEWGRVAAFLFGFALISLPFDYAGGFWIWRKFGRIPPQSPATYLRALCLHTIIYLIIAALILLAGQANCLTAVLALFLVIGFAQVEWQQPIARLIGNMPTIETDLRAEARQLRRYSLEIGNVRVLQATDPAFGGGYSGRPGHATLCIPERWLSEQGSPYTAQQMVRRAGMLRDNQRNLGALMALGLNGLGYVLSALLPNAGFDTGAGLVTIMLAFTIWSALLQVTLLPWTSRQAVFSADYFVAKKGLPKRKLSQTIHLTESDVSAENSFPYPIPSQADRIAQLAEHKKPYGAWQAQHMALYLSWGCLGLLSRSMWQIGRPQLWVMGQND